tara:strand:+ start:3945 stop:7547 length:3603 start_codon:yes stop_codon:yes gene_type:complete
MSSLDDILNKHGLSPTGERLTAPGATMGAFDASVSAVTGQPQAKEDDLNIIDEIGRVLGTGATKAIRAAGSLGVDLGLAEKPAWHIEPLTDEPETEVGKIASTIVQFAIPYTGALKGISFISNAMRIAGSVSKAGKASRAAKALTAGAAADFVAFEANDPFLSALIEEQPALRNPITEFLATDEKDPAAINRLRHAVEGLGLGLAFPQIIKGISKLTLGTAKVTGTTLKSTYDLVTPEIIAAPINKSLAKSKELLDVAYQNVVERNLGGLKMGQQLVSLGKKDVDTELTLMENMKLGNAVSTLQEKGTQRTWHFGVDKHGRESIIETGLGPVPIMNKINTLGKDALKDAEEVFRYRQARMNKASIKEQQRLELEQFKDKHPGKTPPKSMTEIYSGGIPTKEVKAFEKRWAAKKLEDPTYTGQVETHIKELEGMNVRLLDALELEGLMSNAEKLRLLSKGQQHAYFQRERVLDDAFISKQMKKTEGDPTHQALKRLTEEQAEAADKVGNTFVNTIRAHMSVYKRIIDNRIKTKTYDAITEIGERTLQKTHSKEQAKEAMDKWAVRVESPDKETLKALRNEGRLDSFKRNGKDEYWVVKDRFLLDQIQSMGPTAMSDWGLKYIKYASAFKRTVSNLITMNPGFFLYANFLRDTVSVSILSRTGFRPLLDSFAGLGKTLTAFPRKPSKVIRGKDYEIGSDAWFQDFKANGGTFGTNVYAPEGIIRTETEVAKFSTERQLRRAGVKASEKGIPNFGENVGKFVDKVEDFTSRFEYASRTQEYKRLIEAGYSPLKAMVLARDVAIDFGNRGSSDLFRKAAAQIPFLNAHVQGVARTLRALGAKKLVGEKFSPREIEELQRAYAKTATLMQISSLLYFYHLKGEELFGDPSIKRTYDSLPDYVKEKNWVQVFPQDETGENFVIKVPTPFDFAVLPNMAVKLLKDMFDPEEQSVLAEYMKRVVIETGRVGDTSLWPQFARPIVDIPRNKNFAGKAIVPRSLETADPEEQYLPWTNGFFISIGQTLGVSPLKVEYIINSFVGTLGAAAIDAADEVFWRGYKGLPEQTSKLTGGRRSIFKDMFFKRVIEKTPLSATREAEKMFDAAERAKARAAAVDRHAKLLSEFDRKQYKKLMEDPDTQVLLEMNPIFNSYLKEVSELSSQINELNNWGPNEIDARDKVRLTGEYVHQRNELLRELNEVYQEAMRNK